MWRYGLSSEQDHKTKYGQKWNCWLSAGTLTAQVFLCFIILISYCTNSQFQDIKSINLKHLVIYIFKRNCIQLWLCISQFAKNKGYNTQISVQKHSYFSSALPSSPSLLTFENGQPPSEAALFLFVPTGSTASAGSTNCFPLLTTDLNGQPSL